MKKKISRVQILGIPLIREDKECAYGIIEDMLKNKRGVRIFTPNAEILWRVAKDPSLKELLLSSDMLIPDGIGVVLASRLTDSPIPCRITGIDTAEYILSFAEKNSLSVYFLGSKEGVAQAAAENLKKRFPRLLVAGAHHGYFSENEKNALIADIAAKRPQILFVCLGFPAQERFIAEVDGSIPELRLSMGLGGSLDVWSGNTRRAPEPIQRLGLEWAYRLISSPKRIKRLPYLALFAISVIRQNRR